MDFRLMSFKPHFNISLLHNITFLPYPLLVELPNGYKVKVTQIGNVTLGPMISLEKVLYVSSFKYNLISIHTMAAQSALTEPLVLCMPLQ